MDKIQIANILLTRRCNLRCDYCSIVKDYAGEPECYKKISEYNKNELPVEEWIKRLSLLKQNNPYVFIIFYGGEPFLYSQLPELIQYCHDENIFYTIISNNTKSIQPLILDLHQKVGKIRGFTASIDPELSLYLSGEHNDIGDDAIKKTVLGFENLKKLKELGIADDVVAEITVSSKNIGYLYDTLKILSAAKIFSSITTIDLKKSDYYDFSNVKECDSLLKPLPEVRRLFDRIISDKSLLVHIPNVLNDLFKILPCDMKCDLKNRITNVTIDADGNLRLCLRIRGINVPDRNFYDCILPNGIIHPSFKEMISFDYHKLCNGCNWTCMMFTENYTDDDIITHI